MRISDWSSDVCSSDLRPPSERTRHDGQSRTPTVTAHPGLPVADHDDDVDPASHHRHHPGRRRLRAGLVAARSGGRSEEHTSELQSLMRISYAVFCLKKKNHS